MADRKAEIDLKRKKLEELRKSREQKKSESANKAVCRHFLLYSIYRIYTCSF